MRITENGGASSLLAKTKGHASTCLGHAHPGLVGANFTATPVETLAIINHIFILAPNGPPLPFDSPQRFHYFLPGLIAKPLLQNSGRQGPTSSSI